MAKAQPAAKKTAPKKAAVNKVDPKSKDIAKEEKKAAPKTGAGILEKKLNITELEKDDFLSLHQYMKVTKIVGSDIHLLTTLGNVIQIDKEVLLLDSYSAEHFEQEVACNMTELADIL